MKHVLLYFSLFLLTSYSVSAQSSLLLRRIVVTDTITVEEDSVVTLAASSDDAEQENDEIDTLFDDDIDSGWEGDPEDQNILTAGMRFQNIGIPKNATIDSAFIMVWSHEGKDAADRALITIYGDASDNSPTFTEDSLITDRNSTDATVLWEVAEEWEIYQPYRTIDLSAIVQELVNRDGWQSGNAMSFIFEGQDQGPSEVDNAREWEAFENIADPEDGGDGQNHPERVPQLWIYFSSNPEAGVVDIPIVVTDTITVEEDSVITLAASTDDAEQENDEIDTLFDDDIDSGWEGDPEDQNILTAGLRFQNVPVPNGATIDSSYILVFSHEGKEADDVARITIYGDDSDDSPTFTEDSLISDRASTEATILWEVAEEWEIYQPYRTADLSPIIQEIVDREGWVAGNAMSFIFAGEDQGPSEVDNAREWEAFENIADPEDGGDGQNHPERVPRLIIYFAASGATPLLPSIPVTYNQLEVYPNPVDQGILTVELVSAAEANLKLFNHKGQLLQLQVSPYGDKLILDTNNLSAGLYFIQVEQENTLFTQKVLISTKK